MESKRALDGPAVTSSGISSDEKGDESLSSPSLPENRTPPGSPHVPDQDHPPSRPAPHHGSSQLLDDQHLIPSTDVVLGQYRLRFARTLEDLEMVRRLRYAVFNVELGEGLAGAHETGLDADAFDRQCQHLMVLERGSGGVVGTYRMQTADSANAGHGWYTSGEFELGQMPPETLATAAELGRACVARAHRDKTVLFLLWHGLMQYAAHTGVEAFFGCSSLTGTDPEPALALYAQLLREGHVHERYQAPPRLAMACPLVHWPAVPDPEPVHVPKLFATYLRHGAKVLGPPAVDHEFGTVDFLTWVQITPRHWRLFGKPR
jgi:putative hemolysin